MSNPYIHLWAAVLQQGISDAHFVYKRDTTKHRLSTPITLASIQQRIYKDREKADALQWLLSDSDGLGSFVYICNILNCDAPHTRNSITTHWNSLISESLAPND